MSGASDPGFEKLLRRLVKRVAASLANGEYTERGLARLLGISQPHLHHILCGKRSLTANVADLILASLEWPLGDLFSTEELFQLLLRRQAQSESWRPVPLVEGRIGQNSRFPDFGRISGWLCSSARICPSARRIFLAALEPDPVLPFPVQDGLHALVALDETLRAAVDPAGWYVLQWGGAGYVRRIRIEANTLSVLGQASLGSGVEPGEIPLAGRSLLSVVRARLLWAGPDPRKFDPFSQSGSVFPPATAS